MYETKCALCGISIPYTGLIDTKYHLIQYDKDIVTGHIEYAEPITPQDVCNLCHGLRPLCTKFPWGYQIDRPLPFLGAAYCIYCRSVTSHRKTAKVYRCEKCKYLKTPTDLEKQQGE